MLKDLKNSEEYCSVYLFNEEDYETFSKENIHSKDVDINRRRNVVKSKLVDIHSQIGGIVENLGLNPHWSKRNITALPYITPRTEGTGLNWIGLRYGRDKGTVKLMTADLPKVSDEDQEFSFLKFQCIQVGISYEGLGISLFHSNPSNSFDRGYLHDKLKTDTDLQNVIIREINNLKGYGIKWYTGNHIFNIDLEDAIKFIEFYDKYDEYNTYSFAEIIIPRWDSRLKKNEINNTVIDYVDLLTPLYETIKWKPNNYIHEKETSK